MCLLLESIKIEHGQAHNLALHSLRMQASIKRHFGQDKKINLSKKLPSLPKRGLYKCRILYNEKIEQIEISAYQRKKIKEILFIEDDKLMYAHKYADRKCFEQYTKQYPKSAEIIFIKNGLVRDASYSNLCFYNGKEWHTPTYPLLKGVQRSSLLHKGLILRKRIRPSDIQIYEKISFINALNDLGDREYTL